MGAQNAMLNRRIAHKSLARLPVFRYHELTGSELGSDQLAQWRDAAPLAPLPLAPLREGAVCAQRAAAQRNEGSTYLWESGFINLACSTDFH